MLGKAWNEITGQTIANCFRRAGFSQNEDVSCDNKNINLIEIPHITSEAEFENWVELDDILPTEAEITEDDVLRKISKMSVQSSSDESEEVIEEDLPTFNQACQALTTLRRFLKLKGGKDEDYRHIYDLD